MRPHSLVLSGPLLVALASAFATGPHLNTPEKRADSPYANAPIPDPSQCPTGTHVIAASGKGSANVGGYGLIISLVNSILDSVPDSTQVALTYPKQTESNFVSLTTTGTSNLMSYLEDYNTACPDTKITLLGYSSGGVVVMNLLCGASFAGGWVPTSPLSSNWTETISSTIIYGDETFVSGQSFDAGTCTGGDGELPRDNSAACAAFAPTIQSYCNTPDPRCCGGDDPQEHFAYPDDYDSDATDFVEMEFLDSNAT